MQHPRQCQCASALRGYESLESKRGQPAQHNNGCLLAWPPERPVALLETRRHARNVYCTGTAWGVILFCVTRHLVMHACIHRLLCLQQKLLTTKCCNLAAVADSIGGRSRRRTNSSEPHRPLPHKAQGGGHMEQRLGKLGGAAVLHDGHMSTPNALIPLPPCPVRVT